jgi:flagellar FliL protein
MALFGRNKKQAAPAPSAESDADDDVDDDKSTPEVADESSVELKAEALAPKRTGWKGTLIKGGISGLAVTLIAAGGGLALGTQTAATLQRAVQEAQAPPATPSLTPKISGDTVVKALDPVITNLASPLDTWVRLETAMVFKNGSLANPDVSGAQVRQDEIAYLRTIDIAQLEGPSALQHLRDDLNERASLRTNGAVSELIIETLIVQ